MSDLQIHINRAGQQYGPYPEATAREMLAAGQLLPTDLAWHPGAEGWKTLQELLGAEAAQASQLPLHRPILQALPKDRLPEVSQLRKRKKSLRKVKRRMIPTKFMLPAKANRLDLIQGIRLGNTS